MRLLFCALAALLFAAPAQAFHKPSHNPPGQGLPVCSCLAVEIQESVFFHRDRLVFDQGLRNIVGVMIVLGEMECTEPDPEFQTSGEATLRAILFRLDGIEAQDQDFCR